MLGCDCFYWSKSFNELHEHDLVHQPFSLPSPLPQWPQGNGFATGRICLGELEVAQITTFESVWSCTRSRGKSKGTTFYRPVGIPDGFFCLGHYCQSDDLPLRGFVLVAREVNDVVADAVHRQESLDLPALKKPCNYSLVWCADSQHHGPGYIWLPNPPIGYRATGFLVTDTPVEPSVDDIRCVRFDLTETCEACDLISDNDFWVWNSRPCIRGMFGKGVSVGTFFCSSYVTTKDDILTTTCLRNRDPTLHAMPNLDQIHAIIQQYGPTLYFHPDEIYLPSSVEWFFDNGALLYKDGKSDAQRIDLKGSLLPKGGFNDGKFWIDLPSNDEKRDRVKRGNLESAELYVHVKPALGGTFTDIAMWIFCPFNGPATLKAGLANISLNRVGEHVSDWEHFTLRVSNFNGELSSIYCSEHSGGRWVDASNLEYITGNKAIVYASKYGHASYAHPGTYILGSSKFGMGVRNDVEKSQFFVDSSTKYKIISAEYLGDVIEEPCWLQFMREWGPTVTYDAYSELDKIMNRLPVFFRFSVENVLDLFPTELYGEEGPTGPKEKDNWFGDERW
ncbi:hypothetical protein RND81_09G236400 [Saponaria officinalis]|uniref:Vacuolar protein sorting-associated protein 62 n=1 Tax=Saponaria officinalis TaxID=3572 RepID=A0AAW1IPR8_SAPOF